MNQCVNPDNLIEVRDLAVEFVSGDQRQRGMLRHTDTSALMCGCGS